MKLMHTAASNLIRARIESEHPSKVRVKSISAKFSLPDAVL